jgi:hypothetical protein
MTEMWVHKPSGTVYPTAPGTIIGDFDEDIYEFQNAKFEEILRDFNIFQDVLRRMRRGKPFHILLTVSPVPLTASASGKHVLVSTVHSKSILRSVSGQLSMEQSHIDYFPSYEIITNPRLHATSFAANLRSLRDEAVENVMKHFFLEHGVAFAEEGKSDQFVMARSDADGIVCEEELLEAFGS